MKDIIEKENFLRQETAWRETGPQEAESGEIGWRKPEVDKLRDRMLGPWMAFTVGF